MASNKKNAMNDFMFPKLPGQLDMAPVGLVLDAQRKNAEAVNEAMQCTMRGLQKAMMRQVALVTRMVQDNTRLAESLSQEAPERRMQVQADLIGQTYRTSVEGAREVREIMAETEKEMSEIIGARMSASFTEMQSVLGAGRAKAETAPASTN